MHYSKSTNGFYLKSVHGDNIPLDAVEVENGEYSNLLRMQSLGKIIKADINGRPVAVDPQLASASEMLEIVKKELRSQRQHMLDALTGIAGRAMRSGNEAIAAEADTLAVQLLEITDDTALNSAATYEAMKSAGVMAYKRIAGTASPELGVVFREITGA